MGDFRKIVIVLAAMVIFAGFALADAPINYGCIAMGSVPPSVRSESYADNTGDIVLQCSGGQASSMYQAPPTSGTASVLGFANVTVFYTAPVTSRILGSGTGTSAAAASEALLMIDEPLVGSGFGYQVACGSTVAGGVATLQNGCNAQLDPNGKISPSVYGGVVSGQSVTFFGVPMIPPATAGAIRIYRITNVRVSGGGSAASAAVPTPVIGYVSITGAQAVPVSNSAQTVAYIQSGLTTTFRNAANGAAATLPSGFMQCVTVNDSGTNRWGTTAGGFFRFSENFGNAFKVRSNAQVVDQTTGVAVTNLDITGAGNNNPTFESVPGQIMNNTESGFYFPGYMSGSYAAGIADTGTRLKAVFNNVPAGVRVYVSFTNYNTVAPSTISSNSYAQLVSTTGSGESTTDFSGLPNVTVGTDIISGGAAVELPVINGQAVAVWEVTSSLPFQLENFDFAWSVRYQGSPSTNSPAPGAGTVNLSFAPVNTTTGTNIVASTPIPRFGDTSTATRLFNMSPCRTVLLFPFVTNQAGFDTGIAIANTSTDAPLFTTTPQTGTCTLYSYGSNAPAQAYPGPTVASGTVWTTLASSVMPGFQGYVIAACNFQYAHGFAFVSDIGARNLAMGYLALVVPDPGTGGARSATDFTHNGNLAQEILGQ
jgi:hypothetical protein